MLAAIRGINPRDEVESMLAAQMAAVHVATMTFVRRLASTEIIAEADSAERVLNKLARTFATQVEALKRYRTGGEQRVTVEHVHVHSGGQAIVGNVAPGTQDRGKGVGGDQENGEQPHGQIDPAALAVRTAPRCGAKTRAGGQCLKPANRGKKRCRFHGGAM